MFLFSLSVFTSDFYSQPAFFSLLSAPSVSTKRSQLPPGDVLIQLICDRASWDEFQHKPIYYSLACMYRLDGFII